MQLEERWGDRTAAVTGDKAKAFKLVSRLDVERQDDCFEVPKLEPVKLHLWAQALPSSAVAETWSRNMCISHAVLQIHTHFLTWTNSLCFSLERSFYPKEDNYNSFTRLFSPTHFKALHGREN